VITRCELFAGRDEPELLRRFLSPLTELAVDSAIAQLAGRMRSETASPPRMHSSRRPRWLTGSH
jgi:predicted nucleic acid-binding protein